MLHWWLLYAAYSFASASDSNWYILTICVRYCTHNTFTFYGVHIYRTRDLVIPAGRHTTHAQRDAASGQRRRARPMIYSYVCTSRMICIVHTIYMYMNTTLDTYNRGEIKQ